MGSGPLAASGMEILSNFPNSHSAGPRQSMRQARARAAAEMGQHQSTSANCSLLFNSSIKSSDWCL